MRSILPDALTERVELNGRGYRLRPTALRVLYALQALEDEELLQADRLRLFVWLMYRSPRPSDCTAAVDAALKLLDEPSPYRDDKNRAPSFDLEQDAALTCAAFAQLYGLRLPEALADMDWRYFLALLAGITDDTRLGGIMQLRARKLPRRTAHNGQEIAELQRLKAIYALRPKRGRGGQSFEDGLLQMVEILKQMAGEQSG